MYWKGVGTELKDGDKLKSKKYDYTIEKLINPGASIVYQAKRSDGKDIFLKQFRDTQDNTDDWDDFIGFQHSVLNILLQLPNNIVETNYEYFEYAGNHFHAKGFEKGMDLEKGVWDVNHKLDRKALFSLVPITLGILKAVHAKGVVHSDLKPGQFYLIPDADTEIGYRVKLIDFDSCIIPSLGLSRPKHTQGWQSPEHVKQSNISFHSDIFTMGQILYVLITGGVQPYGHSLVKGNETGEDCYSKDIMNKNGYTPLNTLFKGKLPQSLSDIIDQMLEPDANKRPTAAEAHKIILEALNTPSKSKHITLESNGRSRLIVETQTITREIVKSSFGNHAEIYNKQFDIMKDNSGNWFIKGYDVPPSAKDAKGNVYHFYRTLYNGNDVTNKYTKIEDGSVIKVGSTEFKIKAS
ncbi:MAG: hypothetical protein HQL46_13125 [Gammaproteobacteria bacterium]|nr:hypothetical protein [Gammaproteobacteria bacterium]